MFLILMMLLAPQDAPVAAPALLEPDVVVAEQAVTAPVILPVVTVRPVKTNSEAGMAVGHTGPVIVEVDVQPDGTKGAVVVAETSRSDILDAEAVSMITDATLRPPATASRYRIEVVFEPYNFLEMTCRSFALQARWFQQTWPEKSVKDTTLYTASVGIVSLAAMGRNAGTDAVLRGARQMEATWPRLITECERQPNRPYAQVLGRLLG